MNTLEELRALAKNVLDKHPQSNANIDEWNGNFKKLLEELSIYQIELEHQNKELERSEKLLAEAREEYVKLFESTPVGYVILDEERCIVKVNQTFINMFVSSQTHEHFLEGRCFDDFVTAEFKNSFAIFCKMALTRNTPIPMELKLLDRHKTSRYIMLTARAYDLEKKMIAIASSDISMQKAMEDQIIKAQKNEENANRLKSRFLTNVSQELRTPLSVIIGFREIMTDSEISDTEKIQYVNEMIASCEQLRLFSDRILDVSTLESDCTPIQCQSVDMKSLCDNTILSFSRILLQKKVNLNVQTDGIPMLWSDPLRLRQLISSILEYAADNVTDRNIDFSCFYESGYENYGTLHLILSGNEIFSSENDFIRQNELSQGRAAHDSVNMFITKRIINAMKGQMIWEHPLNSLRIKIPTALAPNGHIKETKEETLSINTKEATTEIKTCLLVDDVIMNLKILGTMMKKLGYTPTLATSGGEARNLTNDHHYDIVLTDLWMPEINGEDLAIALRQNPNYDDVPIYAVTADVEYGNNFDMDFFTGTVIKPISLEKLQKIIASVPPKIAQDKTTR